MIKFVKIKLDRKNKNYKNIKFLENVFYLYKKYEKFLNDDYTQNDLLDEMAISFKGLSQFEIENILALAVNEDNGELTKRSL